MDVPPRAEVPGHPPTVRAAGGSPAVPLVVCDIDLQVGGSWRYVSRDGAGTELGWHGVYREIVPGERLVSTKVFEGFPDAEATNTLTLTEQDGVTTLAVTVLHRSEEFRDGHLSSGMEPGMQEVLDRLEDLLDRAVSPSTS